MLTEYEIKSRIVEHLQAQFSNSPFTIGYGTPQSPNSYNLTNAHGCVLVGSNGTTNIIAEIMSTEAAPKKIVYDFSYSIVVSIGLQTVFENSEKLDEMSTGIIDALANVKFKDNRYPVILSRISPTMERGDNGSPQLWKQLYFELPIKMKADIIEI